VPGAHALGHVELGAALIVEGLHLLEPLGQRPLQVRRGDRLRVRRLAAQGDEGQAHLLELLAGGQAELAVGDAGLGVQQADHLVGEQGEPALLDEAGLAAVGVVDVVLEVRPVEAAGLVPEARVGQHDLLDLALADRQAQGLGLQGQQCLIHQLAHCHLVERLGQGAGVELLAEALLQGGGPPLASALELPDPEVVGADLGDRSCGSQVQRTLQAQEEDEDAPHADDEESRQPALTPADHPQHGGVLPPPVVRSAPPTTPSPGVLSLGGDSVDEGCGSAGDYGAGRARASREGVARAFRG
jgi:hypothetical protein